MFKWFLLKKSTKFVVGFAVVFAVLMNMTNLWGGVISILALLFIDLILLYIVVSAVVVAIKFVKKELKDRDDRKIQ